MNKLIGQMIYEAWRYEMERAYSGLHLYAYEQLTDKDRTTYEDAAIQLNRQLNICQDCGRQVSRLFEVADEWICQDCLRPQPDTEQATETEDVEEFYLPGDWPPEELASAINEELILLKEEEQPHQ